MSGVTETNGPPGIFSGIPLSYGSEARRAAPELAADDIDALRRLATRRRHLQQLLKRTEGNAAWAGQVANITDGLDSNSGGELLMQLAEGYRATGNLDLAADTYYLFARQYPDHALVDAALMWLVQFYASGEAAHRAAIYQGTNSRRNPSVEVDAVGVSLAEREKGRGGEGERRTGSPPLPLSPSPILHDNTNATPTVGLSLDDRRRRAVQLAEYLRTARPHLYAEPPIRFAEVTAQRQLGYPNEAKRYFLSLRQLPETMSGAAALPRKTGWRTRAISRRPYHWPSAAEPLYGRISTAGWTNRSGKRPTYCACAAIVLGVRKLSPRNRVQRRTTAINPQPTIHLPLVAKSAWHTTTSFCISRFVVQRSRELSIHPTTVPGHATPICRDTIALKCNLISIAISPRRIHFTVDNRGWSRDVCWDDANWNPTWYIAATDTEKSWTIEAAVPIAVLTNNQPAARHVWAASARRTIPRMGYESWARCTHRRRIAQAVRATDLRVVNRKTSIAIRGVPAPTLCRQNSSPPCLVSQDFATPVDTISSNSLEFESHGVRSLKSTWPGHCVLKRQGFP